MEILCKFCKFIHIVTLYIILNSVMKFPIILLFSFFILAYLHLYCFSISA